ncbi:Putative phospholipase D family member FLJ33580-like protein [Anas platyrhynchos]|uniref:Mitochondrial cardiolipin hydrolase n=1 Tax=Anas platyrhynchos TaxID=8839 RepID=R0LM24_ANAPL|nr:Putative phospholipase D family member FLJ33580-like protein [Anas platyrhynchos]
MHHKFAIVDRKMVITGSLNWTTEAIQNNRENILIMEDAEYVQPFLEEFERIWEFYDPLNATGPSCAMLAGVTQLMVSCSVRRAATGLSPRSLKLQTGSVLCPGAAGRWHTHGVGATVKYKLTECSEWKKEKFIAQEGCPHTPRHGVKEHHSSRASPYSPASALHWWHRWDPQRTHCQQRELSPHAQTSQLAGALCPQGPELAIKAQIRLLHPRVSEASHKRGRELRRRGGGGGGGAPVTVPGAVGKHRGRTTARTVVSNERQTVLVLCCLKPGVKSLTMCKPVSH